MASTLKVGNADVASGQLPQKFRTALLKAPTVAFNAEWVGWAGIDCLARVLANQPV